MHCDRGLVPNLVHEEFSALFLRVVRRGNSMTNGAFVGEDFVIISTLECLVSKEVNLVES